MNRMKLVFKKVMAGMDNGPKLEKKSQELKSPIRISIKTHKTFYKEYVSSYPILPLKDLIETEGA